MSPPPLLLVPFTMLALAARPSDACTPKINPAHTLDPAHSGDQTPPGEVTVTASFAESDDSTKDQCFWEGVMAVTVSAVDDATPADRLGYDLREIRGRFPGALPFQPVGLGTSGILVFYAQSTDIDVTFEVRAVDLNGNYGPPVELTVTHDGGCSTSGAGSIGAGLALLGLARRRRRR